MSDKPTSYAIAAEANRRHHDRNVLGGGAFTSRDRRWLKWGLTLGGMALAVGLFVVATSGIDVHPHPATALEVDGDDVEVTWQAQDCEFVDRDSTVVRAVGQQVQIALYVVRDPAMDCGTVEERTVEVPLPGPLDGRELVDIACTGADAQHAHCSPAP